jgi:hypothetical protein
MKTKPCTVCKKVIKKTYETNADWERRQFCSVECRYKSSRPQWVKDKISAGCKKAGVGNWMEGRLRPAVATAKQREKMLALVAAGTHNFWKGGREKQNCKTCGTEIWFYSEYCVKHATPTKENHWNWKGGITPENHAIRNSLTYKEWRKTVFERDGFKCKIANADCVHEVHAHHILRFSEYPELRFDVNNGITLCKNHHPLKRSHEQELAPTFFELINVEKSL